MPKNVMKLLKPSPHRARNDFDMSHRHVFSINFGELLPSTCLEVVPGDHIEMHASDLIRAIPMVTSPFMRAKQHTEVWFVPYQDLWHNFNQFITQKVEPVSAALNDSKYLPWFNLYDLRDAISTLSSGGTTDIIGRNFANGALRILNYLGYGSTQLGTSALSVKCNLFRLMAYNYIWYNEYRQVYYDDGTNGISGSPTPQAAANLFNLDGIVCDTLANAEFGNYSLLAAASQMRYRCWKKDLFTGLLPNTQFGNVSSVQVSDFKNVNIQNAASASTGTPDYNGGSLELSGITGSRLWNITGSYRTGGDIDVLALRRSEAIQIWRENALRAGNHVRDNMEAHYGIESDFRDHRPTYLGGVSSPLNIGDVMTTANSTTGVNDSVGDIAGKGLSSLDEKIFKYDAKDFGIIMAITSILPEAEYNAKGISRPNQLLEAEDFFIPEYENLGLEAVSSQTFVETPTNVSKVVGYAPRYWGYKTKLDKCYDAFMSGGINAPWCSPKYDVSQVMSNPPAVIPLSTLYVNPKIFDVNFSVSVDNVHQFLCDMYFDVDAVRPMSVVGLPFS